MHVLTQDGMLWRTLPCPIPAEQRHKLQGVRLAGPQPLPAASPLIQRSVSSRGGKRVQLAFGHSSPTINTYVGEWPDTDSETRSIIDAALGRVPRLCPVPRPGSRVRS